MDGDKNRGRRMRSRSSADGRNAPGKKQYSIPPAVRKAAVVRILLKWPYQVGMKD